MLDPLNQWFCDECKEIILGPDDGNIIWKHDDNDRAYDFKIIHNSKCDNSNYPSSMPINMVLGESGLNVLLSMLSIGIININQGQTERDSIKDISEFIDFIRRVQFPYYEEARIHFSNPTFLEHFSYEDEMSPYKQDILKLIAAGSYST